MYIKFLSTADNKWGRLDESIIKGFCNPISLMGYWKEIINDEYCAVAQAFLYDANDNIEGMYIRNF